MPTYRKRNESSVVTSVLGYLQTLENLGKIAFYNRQQAGSITFQRGGKFSKVRLGREGVADIWVILDQFDDFKEYGTRVYPFGMLWIECKQDVGTQSHAQKEFQKIAEGCGHHYWIIRDCDELEAKFKEIGVL